MKTQATTNHQGDKRQRQDRTQPLTTGYDVLSRAIQARKDIRAAEKLVMLALQQWGWKSKRCTAARAKIAEAAGLSEATVKRSITQLVQLGLVQREEDRRYATGRALVLTWLDDPQLHPQDLVRGRGSARRGTGRTDPRGAQIDPPPGQSDPAPGQIEPQSNLLKPRINTKTSSSSRADDDVSAPPVEFGQIVEAVRARFGDDVAKVIVGNRRRIEREFAGRLAWYLEAVKRSADQKHELRNPIAYFRKVALDLETNGEIPPAPVAARSTPKQPRPPEPAYTPVDPERAAALLEAGKRAAARLLARQGKGGLAS
jgi:DNA-binding MarR family transcriptional regulator